MTLAAWGAPQTVAVGAAVLAAVAALIGVWVSGLRAERLRRRGFYAQALETTYAYREFAYVIRRRRADVPGEERIRISEALREIQRDLARHQALMQIERCRDVCVKYQHLVEQTRHIAGGYMREAWKQPPATEDAQMNIAGIDFSALKPYEDAYLKAIANDLPWWKFWR